MNKIISLTDSYFWLETAVSTDANTESSHQQLLTHLEYDSNKERTEIFWGITSDETPPNGYQPTDVELVNRAGCRWPSTSSPRDRGLSRGGLMEVTLRRREEETAENMEVTQRDELLAATLTKPIFWSGGSHDELPAALRPSDKPELHKQQQHRLH